MRVNVTSLDYSLHHVIVVPVVPLLLLIIILLVGQVRDVLVVPHLLVVVVTGGQPTVGKTKSFGLADKRTLVPSPKPRALSPEP